MFLMDNACTLTSYCNVINLTTHCISYVILLSNIDVLCSYVASYNYITTLQLASYISRLTVVSREAKKKQHACASSGPRDHYSELFTRMAALKF